MIRKEISQLVARAQKSVSDDPQDNHNLNQITTDRIMALFMGSLPSEVDVDAKYELNGAPISLILDSVNRSEEQNLEQVVHIARFADDNGFNRCVREIKSGLQSEYKV